MSEPKHTPPSIPFARLFADGHPRGAASPARATAGRHRPFRTTAALLALTIGACEHAPVAPVPTIAPEPLPASRASFPLEGYSSTITLPVSGADGAAPKTPLPSPLPEGGYVRVRTDGGVRRTLRPEYNDAPCGGIGSTYCDYRIDPYGSGLTTGNGLGNEQMRVKVGAFQADGVTLNVKGSRVLPNGEQEWLIGVAAGTQLGAYRTGHRVYKDYCPSLDSPCAPRLYAYELEAVGTAGVIVEGVVPLRVEAPAGIRIVADTVFVPRGDTLTFPLTAVDGMKQISWKYADNVNSSSGINCYEQRECRIVVLRSNYATQGTVQVTAVWANGTTHTSQKLVVKAEPPELVLECNGQRTSASVVRGAPVECVVKKKSATTPGTIIVEGWTFATAPRKDEPLTSTTWAGPMVQPGVVQVKARINADGQVQTKSVDISVGSRDWRNKTVPVDPPLTITHDPSLSTRPKIDDDLGSTDHGTRIVLTEGVHYSPVTTGPNAGLVYLTEVPRSAYVRIYVAQGALTAGSDFYLLQNPGPAQTNPTQGQCNQGDLPAFLPVVEAHEGVPDAAGNFPLLSHAGIFTRKLNEVAGPRTEGLVQQWSSVQQLATDITPVLLAITTIALDASDDLDRNHPILYCRFRWFTP